MSTLVNTLHSGFVAFPSDSYVRNVEEVTSFKTSLHRNKVENTDTANYYHIGVEALFQRWHKNEKLVNDMQFREDVLKLASTLFRSINIQTWVLMQLKANTVGPLHRRYLADTFFYALCDVPRKMENYSYYRLLNATETSKNWPARDDELEDELKAILGANTSLEISHLLCRWTGSVAGIVDLIQTMHVIYGRRHGSLPYSRTIDRGE